MKRNLSEAAKKRQYEAQRAWHKKNTESIHMNFKKWEAELFKQLARDRGVSLTSLVRSLLEKELEKESKIFEGSVEKMEIKNIERFKEFLDENLKTTCGTYDFEACLEDLETQVMETGSDTYELSGFETKSGNPELIRFEKTERFFKDGEEVTPCDDFDEIKTTIIF